MTLNTPVYGFPYPENTDAPNGPAQFNALASAIETVLVRMDTQSVQRQYTALGVTVWNKPAGLKGIYAWVTGAGGGGGGATTAGAGTASPAAGGAGASTAFAWIPAASLGASENVTVGTGGTAGAAAGNGGAGGNSSFGALLVANGGTGGSTAGASAAAAFSAQVAYAPAVSGTASPITGYLGSIGARGIRLNGTDSMSGRGGAAGMGGGQTIDQIGQNNGATGIIPGGGAGGGFSINGGGAATGGVGARGQVDIIEVF